MKFADYGNPGELWDLLEQLCRETIVRSYLEVGVSDGGSLRRVVSGNKNLEHLVLCDQWTATYGGSGRGSNAHIKRLLAELEYKGDTHFLDGDSKVQIPTLRGCKFDLVNVDGDHSDAGALIDLTNCWPLVAPGGFLTFDDIVNDSHPTLRRVFWDFVKAAQPEWADENVSKRNGVGVMRKAK